MLLKLPQRAEEILNSMISEKIKGASYLAEKCVEFYIALIEENISNKEIVRLSNEIVRLFPTVAPIYNVSDHVMKLVREIDDKDVILKRLKDYLTEIQSAKSKTAEIFIKNIEIPSEVVFMTHSYSSAVLELFKKLSSMDISFEVILTESRPDFEGIHLANELEDLGIKYEIITDAQMGLMIKRADVVVVGADCITRRLDVINKAGTFLLALSANYYSVPFYVLAERFKFHPIINHGEELELMERELTVQGKAVRNILFDVTPSRLVTAILTERDIVKPL
ncbi:MAG: translation initiation factor IF-2B subunit alpha [Thermoplasmata archaeon]|nr:translation initiation factor IF-2B subunit alpha [Euryarchaeota archaeon]RLF67372.1 MAG: translation initiation factor IF-2B subunit alpha [Thermoplasmata archaeon]